MWSSDGVRVAKRLVKLRGVSNAHESTRYRRAAQLPCSKERTMHGSGSVAGPELVQVINPMSVASSRAASLTARIDMDTV